jgi:DNA-binding LacI/PurR family transcriptional regulator
MSKGPPAGGRPRFVAVLLPESQKLMDDRSYYGPMLQGLSDALLEKGLHLRPVQCLHEYQKEQFLCTPGGLYAGVVFMGQLFTSLLFVEAVVKSMPGPKVVLDHHFEGLPVHSVREDSVAGMRLLAEHLLALGHRHIAYLDNDNPEANPWKREGINQGLRAAGLEPLQRGWVAGCRCNFSDTADALDWFMGLEPRPTAVMTCGDVRALLLLQAAAERGLSVPGDVSISGYGDLSVRTGSSRTLTSVGVDPALMGRKAAELVSGPADAAPVAMLVPPDLAARGTTGPAPGAG